jgi:hypothetical protein
MPVTAVLLLRSSTCLPSGFRSPTLAYCLSGLVHSCRIASPFPLRKHEPLPWCPSCWFSAQFSIRPSRSIQQAASSVPSSADKFEAHLFPHQSVTMLGLRVTGPRIRTFNGPGGIAQSEQWLDTGWKVRGSNPGRGEISPHQSRPALGHNQPPIQWLSGLSRG